MLKDYNIGSTDALSGIKIKSNYHTHNYLCGHAGGTVCDYVQKAVECGMEVLGISDHCESPLGTYEPYITPQTLRTKYLPQFDTARKLYGDRIRILSAVEIEYFSVHDEYYDDLLENLDYLVMGQHEYMLDGRRMNSFCDGVDTENVVAYCECVIEGLRSKRFALLAHPDLIFYRRPKLTSRMTDAFERMVREAFACGVALELNANGIRYHNFNYPTDLLIELCKKYNAPVVVSSDAHSPEYLADKCTLGLYDYAAKHGLNLIDFLDTEKFKK